VSQAHDLSLNAPFTVSEIAGVQTKRRKITFFFVEFTFLFDSLLIATNIGYRCFVADMDDEAETYKLWRVRKTIMQVRHTRHQLTHFPCCLCCVVLCMCYANVFVSVYCRD